MRAGWASTIAALLLAMVIFAPLAGCAKSYAPAPVVEPPPPPPPPPPPAPPPPPPPPPAFYVGDETTSGGIRPVGTSGVPHPLPAGTSPARASSASVMSGHDDGAPPPLPSDARDAQIASEVQGFRPFDVLFNQPTLLPYNQQTLIRFVIASKDIEEAKAEFADTTGVVTTDQARLGRQVRAQLTGPGEDVQIQIVGTDVRDISAVANTTIDWYVTPRTTETFKLTLRLFNRVFDGTRWIEVQGPPYVKEFQVSVSNTQKVQLLLSEINGWLALLGSSIVALFGLAFAKLRTRFAAKKPASPAPPA